MSPQNRAVQPVVMAIVAALITPAAGLATPMKIACVGDSITEGSGLSFPNRDSYPAKLQQLLGTNYLVRNFGVSGRTLLKKGDFPFWAEPAFTSSHTFNPDVVIINLGTNDAKPQNWRYGTNYTTDYDALIATYTALATHPRMVLCTPCPAFKTGAFDINPGVVNPKNVSRREEFPI